MSDHLHINCRNEQNVSGLNSKIQMTPKSKNGLHIALSLGVYTNFISEMMSTLFIFREQLND